MASDTVTRRICTYLSACGIEDAHRQSELCQRVVDQVDSRLPYKGEGPTEEIPFRTIQPLIDEALAAEAGFPEPQGDLGGSRCHPRLLQGVHRPPPAFRSAFTWEGPTPVPVKMPPQDLTAFPSFRRIGFQVPRPSTSWSWVTMGGLAFIIVVLW